MPKTTDFDEKPWSLMKICRFWLKTTVLAVSEFKTRLFFIKICSFHQNPQILEENLQFSSKSAVFIKIHGFQKKIYGFHRNLWFLSKSADFGRKSTVFRQKICGFVKIHRFSSKSADFSHEIRQNPRILFCKIMRFRPLIK